VGLLEDAGGASLGDDVDISREEHRTTLRRIGELCHQYGLEFVFATWQQRPWSVNPDIDHDPRIP
jgi:hypothetical protein